MKLVRGVATFAVLALTLGGVARAEEQVDQLLKRWTQYVDQSVEVDGCYFTYATVTNVYCDAMDSRLRLYMDIDSMDPQVLQQAIANCPDWELRPECKVTLSGTMRASFGSPMLYDATGAFAQ